MLRDPPREQRRRDRRGHPGGRGSDVGVRHPQDGQQRAHRSLRREAAAPNGCPGWCPSCRAAAAATWRRWASTSSSARCWSRRSPTRSWSTSAATSSPTRCRASACRRTSTAATGRTSGRSSRTSRPTWRCATPIPPFDFYDAKRPVYTHPRFLPASKLEGCNIHNALISRGLHHARRRDRPRRSSASAAASARGVKIRNSLLIGADFYETLEEMRATEARGVPPVGIGAGLDHRERDHRQERAHRPRRAHRQRGRASRTRRRRLLHPRRHRHRPQERRHPERHRHLISAIRMFRFGVLGVSHFAVHKMIPAMQAAARHAGRRDRVA